MSILDNYTIQYARFIDEVVTTINRYRYDKNTLLTS